LVINGQTQVNPRRIAQLLRDGPLPAIDRSIAADTIDALLDEPLPLVLYCQACGKQHVDAPEPETGWTNPPHRSHKCAGCGWIWRPADFPTVGVAKIHTSGERDSLPGAELPYQVPAEALRRTEGLRLRVSRLRDRLQAALRELGPYELHDAMREMLEGDQELACADEQLQGAAGRTREAGQCC
ncbi:MAG TPA: hypothetical protein VEB23_08290, partial [Ramlibacter sp.]|nr:hypothetical protein [Ramlibacter sp.]